MSFDRKGDGLSSHKTVTKADDLGTRNREVLEYRLGLPLVAIFSKKTLTFLEVKRACLESLVPLVATPRS